MPMTQSGLRQYAAALTATGLIASLLPVAASGAVFHTMLAGRAPADRGIATTVPRTRGLRDLGAMPANGPVRIGILLRYRHEAELEMLVRLQGERTSPYYHHYLTPAQWNGYFAPTVNQYRKVAESMRRAGFIVDAHPAANLGLVMGRGRAISAETYFHTKLHRVAQDGHLRYANVTDAVMPAEIRQESVSVLGLHSIEIAHYPAMHVTHPRGRLGLRFASGRPVVSPPLARPGTGVAARFARPNSFADDKPITNATPSPNPNPDPTLDPIVATAGVGGTPGVEDADSDYAPYAMAVAYDYPVLHGWDGNGRSTGSVISSDFANSDLNGYITTFSLPRALLPAKGDDALTHRVNVDGGSTAAAEGEETLDVEAIVGLSPGTNFYEYLIPELSDLEIVNAYNQADSDAVVDGLNSSFGGCESDDPSGDYSEDYVAMQGVSKGITFSASTGDTGSQGCEVIMNGAPGTAPGIESPSGGFYFTAVGGTSILLNPNTGALINEMGWIDGGGGISKINPLPDWQTATIMGATSDVAASSFVTPAQNSGRNVPDIALFSDAQDGAVSGGFAFYYQGAIEGVGGTSLSSPLWIAMQSEIDEIQGSKNGWVNPRLYAVYNQNGYVQFRDITLGNNTAYTNETGYDNVSGIGVPLGFELGGTE